jgi:hypothetical protein
MSVTMLCAGFGNGELGETLENVHLGMLLFYYLIMYDEWSVVGDILCLAGLGYVEGEKAWRKPCV